MKDFINEYLPLIIGFVLCFFLCVFIFYARQELVKEEANWAVFVKEHDCKVIKQTSGHTEVSFGGLSNGKTGMVLSFSLGETCWECNDGVTYCK